MVAVVVHLIELDNLHARMDCFDHKLVVEEVDIEVNNSVGVVDKELHDIVVVRIGRLVDHMLVDEEVDMIDSVEHH